MSKYFVVVVVLYLTISNGCTVSRSTEGRYTLKWRIWETIFGNDDRDTKNSATNQLWRQGYGFNNPNNERIREGKAPVNFDGSVHE